MINILKAFVFAVFFFFFFSLTHCCDALLLFVFEKHHFSYAIPFDAQAVRPKADSTGPHLFSLVPQIVLLARFCNVYQK